jgi:sugar phosphate isomerase/epimerase
MHSISRRSFFGYLASVGALGGLPAPAAGNPSFSLGFSLYGMKSLPLDEALSACARIGYRNVELALNPGYPTEPAAFSPDQRTWLRERLRQLGLEVSGLMLNLSLAADDATHARHLDSLRAAARFAHDISPEKPPVIETVLGGKPAEWEAIKERMALRLAGWAAAASEGGVAVALKAHVGSAVNTPERLLWLLEKAPGSSVCAAFDYSHFALQGLALEETLSALLPRTRFIHVKDAEGDPQKFRFLLPGEGRTDYARYFRHLADSGYRGPVVVEVSAQVFNQPGYEATNAAAKCFASLAAAMERASASPR